MYPLVRIPSFANKDFFAFTKSEAKEYLQWFLSIKDERIKILEIEVQKQYAYWKADYTKASLVELYEWFKQNVAYRPISDKEQEVIRIQLSSTPLLANVIPIPAQTFTDETVSICFDVGVYFGETIIFNATDVNWLQKVSSTNFIDYAQPLIGKKNIKAPINPRRAAEGYARRILDKKIEETPPEKLFDILIEKFNKE
jgi:hypothetical protein